MGPTTTAPPRCPRAGGQKGLRDFSVSVLSLFFFWGCFFDCLLDLLAHLWICCGNFWICCWRFVGPPAGSSQFQPVLGGPRRWGETARISPKCTQNVSGKICVRKKFWGCQKHFLGEIPPPPPPPTPSLSRTGGAFLYIYIYIYIYMCV